MNSGDKVSKTSSSVQFANDSRRAGKQDRGRGNESETFTFPAPISNLQNHSLASTAGVPGLWAYTADYAIVVVRAAEPPRKWPTFTMMDGSGWDKYTSVGLCQEVSEKWPIKDAPLVAASKGGVVRIFNIENTATIKFHTCHIEHRAIAEWSPRNPRLIFGADDAGQVSIWDVVDNSSVLLNIGNFETVCMAVNPYEDDIVALGDKDGSVRIVNTAGSGSVVHVMQHFKEIFSLAWKPRGVWNAVTKLRKQIEPFLAISSANLKPPQVKICDREGKSVATLGPAADVEGQPRKLIMRNVPSIWTVLPAKSSEEAHVALISIGCQGEILSWKENDPAPQILHKHHMRCAVFAIVQSGDILWSASTEPYIVGWNLKTSKLETIIPTYAGICSISASTIEHTRLVLGGVDSFIRILKVEPGYPNDSIPEVPLLPNRVQGKVTAVCWHPILEKLGFGTDAGILGIYDIKADNPYVMEFTKRVAGTIYTVDWGPKCYTPDFQPKDYSEDGKQKQQRADCLWLYACGNRSAFAIHPSRRDNALVNIGRIIGVTNNRPDGRVGASISEIKWTPDHLYFAVGYTDGKIEIYVAPHLILRCWIKTHSSSIQYLSWRSLDFFETDAPMKKQKFFASAANDGTGKVYNLAGLYEEEFRANTDSAVMEVISSLCILNGHRGLRVIQVAWSPHNDNHILTVSYDRTAVIWDIKNKTRIARYVGHEHRLVACVFHPANESMVLTCSDEMVTDPCFHMWNYREHPENENYQQNMACVAMSGSNAECVKALAAPLPKVMFRPGSEDESVSKHNKEKRPIQKDPKARQLSKIRDRKTLLPLLAYAKLKNSSCDIGICPNEKGDSHVFFAEESGKCVPSLNDLETQDADAHDENVDTLCYLSLFGSRQDVVHLIRAELDTHIKKENWASAICLLPWLPDPQTYIEKITAAGHMEESMVIFAKKCSRKFQIKMAEDYAAYLIKKGKIYEGVSYYWDILESFEMTYSTLVDQNWLLDALVFSKLNRIFDSEEDSDTINRLIPKLQENMLSSVVSNIYLAFHVENPDTVTNRSNTSSINIEE